MSIAGTSSSSDSSEMASSSTVAGVVGLNPCPATVALDVRAIALAGFWGGYIMGSGGVGGTELNATWASAGLFFLARMGVFGKFSSTTAAAADRSSASRRLSDQFFSSSGSSRSGPQQHPNIRRARSPRRFLGGRLCCC